MSALALPYVQLPTLAVDLPLLGEQTIAVFGPLVVLGVFTGHRLSLRFARARGMDTSSVDRLAVAVAVGGFVVAHWFSVLLYFPEQVRHDPWILLHLTSGLSSMGGFLGGALTFAWLTRRRRLDAIAHADVLTYGLLAGFTIGRLGCTLVHDHPGMVTDAWFGVGPWPDDSTRWDLGLVELSMLVPVCAWVYRHDWRREVPGRLTVTVALAYAVLRFPLDFLRAQDARYGPLTPAQYACVAVALAVLWYWRRAGTRSASRRTGVESQACCG